MRLKESDLIRNVEPDDLATLFAALNIKRQDMKRLIGMSEHAPTRWRQSRSIPKKHLLVLAKELARALAGREPETLSSVEETAKVFIEKSLNAPLEKHFSNDSEEHFKKAFTKGSRKPLGYFSDPTIAFYPATISEIKDIKQVFAINSVQIADLLNSDSSEIESWKHAGKIPALAFDKIYIEFTQQNDGKEQSALIQRVKNYFESAKPIRRTVGSTSLAKSVALTDLELVSELERRGWKVSLRLRGKNENV